MTLIPKYDPLRIAFDLRDQVSSATRRLGFLLGAGSSMAAGIPGLEGMTDEVAKKLATANKQRYEQMLGKLGASGNLETILTRVRLIRELLADTSTKVDELTSAEARDLDVAISAAVVEIVSSMPTALDSHISFATWIRYIERDHPIEVFTTNYDLLAERAFEAAEVPYFDGFVGVAEAFFVAEAVEADRTKKNERNYPPSSWTRLWKLHGSVGWRLSTTAPSKAVRIVRGDVKSGGTGTELLIYPSREKYSASRKLPFLVYIDHLRQYLSIGEVLFVTCGYSFHDEHINYVLTQGLRSNPRASIHAFMFEPISSDLETLATLHRNLSIFAPDSAILGSFHAGWQTPSRSRQAGEEWPFWDEGNKKFLLGDFKALTAFLAQTTQVVTSAQSAPPAPGATKS